MAALAMFSRALGPLQMGVYGAVVTLTQFAFAIFSAGFDQAFIKAGRNSEVAKNLGSVTSLQALVVAAFATAAFLSPFSPVDAKISNHSLVFSLVIGSIVCTLIANLYAADLAIDMRYKRISMIRLVSALSGLGVGVLFYFIDKGLVALAVRDFITGAMAIWLYALYSKYEYRHKITKTGLVELWEFAKGLWLLNLAERFILRLDLFIVGILFGLEVFGAYYVVRMLVEGVLAFVNYPIQTLMFNYYCRWEETGERFTNISSISLALFIIAICTIALVATFGDWVLLTLLGAEYDYIFHVAVPLTVYGIMMVIFENFKALAMSRVQHFKLIYCRALQLTVFLITVYPLTSLFDISGAVFSTLIGAVVLTCSSGLVIVLGGSRNKTAAQSRAHADFTRKK